MDYSVVYREDDEKWVVKGVDVDKPAAVRDVKGDAIIKAIRLAKKNGGDWVYDYPKGESLAGFLDKIAVR